MKTQDAVIRVNAGRTDLIKVKEIDGRQQLVIGLQGPAEVNGVEVRPMQ